MNYDFVEKSIEIKAPAIKVWKALTNPELTKHWITAFAPLSRLESDWQAGSSVLWHDLEGKVALHGDVISVEPEKALRYTVGPVNEKRPQVGNGPDGIFYNLTENNGVTTFTWRQGDFSSMENGEVYFKGTEVAVSKVLPIVKKLAEN